MGTVVNGNIWSGACVAGKEITGLVKNGVVFYKREIPTPSVYKRRIMVGDNLYQVKISSDYPENFYEVFPNNPIQEILINTSGGDMSFQTTVLNYSYGSLVISSFGDRLKDWYESSSENVTTYGNQETIFGNSIPVSERNNYNVTEIVNNENSNSYLAQAYRHLFIEDPNIRPIEVGDKLVSGTKLYFIFPDNLTDILGYIDYEDSMFIAETEDGETSLFLYSSNIYDENKTTINMQWNGISSSTYPYLYEYDLIENKLISNLSSFILTDEYVDNKTNTVISINKNSPLYNYILIDMTTLGA